MAEMDDLFKAMGMFTGAVRQYQTQQAVNDASKMMMDLNAQALDEKQRLQANQQIGNDLALRLTGIGASPEQIQGATQGLLMSPSSQRSAITQMDVQRLNEEGQNKRAEARNRTDLEIAGINAQRASQAKAQQQQKFTAGRMDAFTNRADVKEARESISKLGDLRQILDEGKSPIGSALAKFGLLRAAGAAPISDADLATAEVKPGMRAAIARQWNIEVNQEDLADRQQFYRKVLSVMGSRAKARLKESISGEAQAVNLVDPDIDPTTFEKALTSRFGATLAGPHQTAISEAEKWLQANPNDPKAAAVKAKIQKLQQDNF